jgi:hypothetical protein
MAFKPTRMRFSAHAANMLYERSIERDWVEAALAEPEWTEPDSHPERRRAFRTVAEAGGKILRVVYTEEGGEYRVVTVFFDRNAKRP